MTIYTTNWIYLGNLSEIDTDEAAGDLESENPDAILGTYSLSNSDLQITEVSIDDADNDSTFREDDANQTAESLTYDVGGGSQTSDLDSATLYNVTIKYSDGTTQDTTIVVSQLQDGATFLSNRQALISGQSIESFELTSLNSDGFGAESLPPNNYVGTTLTVCFTSGTKIVTENGESLIDDLQIGDKVKTLDNGFQEIRFIHKSTERICDENRPVIFEKGAIGNDRRLRVSPHHRMYTTSLPKNVVSEDERLPKNKLIWAKELVNGTNIRFDMSALTVTYFHIMLARHELLFTHGVISESWQPTRKNLKRDPVLANKLRKAYPEIANMTGNNHGRLVREEITIDPVRIEASQAQLQRQNGIATAQASA